MSQLLLAGGLWTVIGTVVVAILYRSKTQAETRKMENEAAKIADETFTRRVQFLKAEMFDAMGLSEQRRQIISKMDTAINIMRLRVERHGRWDDKVRDAFNELTRELKERGIDVDVELDAPPSLSFEDIDFDFRANPPSKEIVEEIAKQKGIDL